jgi:hypothetical protein
MWRSFASWKHAAMLTEKIRQANEIKIVCLCTKWTIGFPGTDIGPASARPRLFARFSWGAGEWRFPEWRFSEYPEKLF